MGKGTGIQWCDDTANPTTGCDGCELWKVLAGRIEQEIETTQSRPSKLDIRAGGPCYAGNQHEGRMAKLLPDLYAADFREVRLAPGRMSPTAGWSDLTGKDRPDKPWLNGMPRTIFVGDMADLFSRDVPFEYILDEVVATAASVKGSRHIYMLLTKQPNRMAEFGSWLKIQGIAWPDNLWAGTSITSTGRLKRVEQLKRVPAKFRFLSLEPLWECVDLSHHLDGIAWVIVGGQSDQPGHEARPFELDWARNTIRDCRRADVACFLKQLGSRAIDEKNGIAGASLKVSSDAAGLISRRLKDHHGGDWSEWPEDLRVREFPKVAA